MSIVLLLDRDDDDDLVIDLSKDTFPVAVVDSEQNRTGPNGARSPSPPRMGMGGIHLHRDFTFSPCHPPVSLVHTVSL
nr:hypothetical protein CFP56_10153 [Quercus suber]